MIDHTDVVRSRSVQRRRLALVVVAGSLLAGPVLAACAPGVDVAVEERARTPIADPSGDPSGDPAPTRPTASDSDPSSPVSTEPPAVPSTDSSTLAWGSCATFGIPSPSLLGTTHWECSTLDVPMDPIIGYGMTDDEQAILRRFFAGRTVTEIPANRAKRQVLLQRLALEFDVGRRYTEREVNEILFAFHPDWSTLRRYLVDEGFLDREHLDEQNWYWRAGGRVTDLPSAEPDQ